MLVIIDVWGRSACSEELVFISQERPSEDGVIWELDGGCFVLNENSEVLCARDGSQGEESVAEAFNVVNICEAKNGFLTIVRGEEAFTGAFEGGCLIASISK